MNLTPPLAAYRARWVWAGPGQLREGWCAILAGGRVAALGPHADDAPVTDLGEGVLLPGLVNAHTHVELSGLAGLATPRGDFVDWLEKLASSRPTQIRENAGQATLEAARGLALSGTALVGDVTNTGLARAALAQAGLSQVSLWEALGAANAEPPAPKAHWRGPRLDAVQPAAHAPYSVPGWRIAALKRRAGQGVFAIHLAESRAEVEYLADEGPEGQRFADFLISRYVHREDLGLLHHDGLEHLLALGVVDSNTLLVHCTQFTPVQVRRVAAQRASVCVCPRSNLGLVGQVAPLEDLLAAGVNLCLGTDSLVSTPSLNLWE